MGQGSRQCPVAYVAPDDCVGRHAPLPMSLGATGESDLVVDPCRTAHVRAATQSRSHVALHELVERQARVATSPLARIRSDIQRWQRRASRGSGATCSRFHVASRACEVRHRSGCSVARSLEQGDIPPLAWHAVRVDRATYGGHMGDERPSASPRRSSARPAVLHRQPWLRRPRPVATNAAISLGR